MKNLLFILFGTVLILTSCNRNLDQSSMFHGREKVTKKKGIYDAGMNSRKPMSVQIAEEYRKQNKHVDNPKKAAKLAEKEMQKKKRASAKARAKYNKKRHVKVKTTKGKSSGDS